MGGRAPHIAIAALALAALAPGCAGFPPLSPYALDPPWQVSRAEHPALAEPSGLVASRRYPGVFWTHNDSGHAPQLFAITTGGEVLVVLDVAGVSQTDWEDIAADDAGNLYVGDFGNNANDRRDLHVVRIPEPDPYADSSAVAAAGVLPFRYADQTEFPGGGARNFDAEALFWMDGALHILTKHRSDAEARLYRLPVAPAPATVRALEPIATLETGERRARFFGTVTAADWNAAAGVLAVLTYRAVYLYAPTGDPAAPFRPLHRIDLPRGRTRQAESLAWDGAALIVGNEEGYLVRIPTPLSP